MVTPIIATIKNIMDKKEKIDNASQYINHYVQHQSSGDRIDSTRTDEDSIKGELESNRVKSEPDKNRKF